MKNDLFSELNLDMQEKFIDDMFATIDLLDLKELKDFTLGIDYEDPECQDFILKIRGINPEEREKIQKML